MPTTQHQPKLTVSSPQSRLVSTGQLIAICIGIMAIFTTIGGAGAFVSRVSAQGEANAKVLVMMQLEMKSLGDKQAQTKEDLRILDVDHGSRLKYVEDGLNLLLDSANLEHPQHPIWQRYSERNR